MCLPALRAIRAGFPGAHIAIQARPWVADLYARESFCDEIVMHTAARGAGDWKGKLALVQTLRNGHYDTAILLQNAFEAAALAWAARIPRRIGYNRDGRGLLLTHAIPVPRKGELPPQESYYYLELLRRAGVLPRLPSDEPIRLDGAARAAQAGERFFAGLGIPLPVVGVSPGAAYGSAKRWPAGRFAESALILAKELNAAVAVFGSAAERPLAEEVAIRLRTEKVRVENLAGSTSLRQFIDLAAACRVFLTNDSGAMHVASALGVPTVAIFGPTDHIATGPHGPLARVVREPVECSPCLLRECPIDHRCMTGITAGRVAQTALKLVK